MESRANSAEVRNPVLALRSARRLQELPPDVRALLRDILLETRVDANAKAEESWRRRKGPIACYWRAVSTYALHLARVLRPPRTLRSPTPARVAVEGRLTAPAPAIGPTLVRQRMTGNSPRPE
jgi:hypothetical protein